MTEYRAALIGGGQIAAGYDEPGSSVVLTHAHALQQSPRFDCMGFYDPKPDVSTHVAKKWGLTPFASLEDLLRLEADLVIVAVPDAVHQEVLNELLEFSPKVVLCEKPLTRGFDSSREIVERYHKAGVHLLVNYQRRFDPTVVALHRRWKEGDLGKLLNGCVWYSKGILHNGSHAVDLLRFFFGEVTGLTVSQKVWDYSNTDPTVSAVLSFESGSISLLAGDERKFSLFEVDLLFERERWRFSKSGLFYERFVPDADPDFPGYIELKSLGETRTGLDHALLEQINTIARLLDGEESKAVNAVDALNTQWVCEQLCSTEVAAPIAVRAFVDRKVLG